MIVVRSGLCSEQVYLRSHLYIRIILDHLISGYDPQNVKQLTLVLVEPLCLDDENTVRVQESSGLLVYLVGEEHLVFVLYLFEPLLY